MLAALVQHIQTDFNESFRQVFSSHLPVRWPHFTPLIRTLTTGHFHPDTVTMSVGFRHNLTTAITPHQNTAPPYKTSTEQRGGEQYTATSQVEVQNSTPLPHLQVGPGFRLRQSMEQTENKTGAPVPQINDGRPFCFSYHLKGVCNSTCGGRHAHRTLFHHKQGVLSAWIYRFCSAPPPVTKIAAPPWAPGGTQWGIPRSPPGAGYHKAPGAQEAATQKCGRPHHPPQRVPHSTKTSRQ